MLYKNMKRKIFIFFSLLITLIIAIIICEIFFRIFPEKILGKGGIAFNSWYKKYVSLNNEGFWDYNYEYNSDKKTILVIGDSFSFGHGLNNFKNTYAKQLEKLMSNDNYRVINLSKCGWDMSNAYDILLKKGIKYKPQIVICQFYLNDIPANEYIKKLRYHSPFPKNIHNYLFNKSYFYNFIIFTYNYIKEILGLKENFNQAQAELILNNSEQYQLFLELVIKTKNFCKEQNIDFIYILWPVITKNYVKFSKAYKKIEEDLLKEKINVINLDNYFQERKDKNDLILSVRDVHPSVKGHKLTSEIIFKYLKRK